MKRLINILVIWILGTVLHFVYGLSGRNSFIALFAPINESVWEHYKLAFYPLLFAGLMMAKDRGMTNMAPAILFALAHSAFTMFGIYYFYTAALGSEHILIIDILNFFISTAVGYGFLTEFGGYEYTKSTGIIAFIGIILLILTLWRLTYYPAKLPLFIDFSKRK